jgi:glycosyltransferase involved in cell wall biosynthesis
MERKKTILGIDAMNIRDGGGLTHLREILLHVTIDTINFDKVIVWGNEYCLQQLPDQPWLTKINPILGKTSGFHTTYWQIFCLGKAARELKCNLLFIAGGSAITSFQPKVTICHNMLPFTDTALQLYPTGIRKLKFFILRYIQLFTFRRAVGVIFVSDWARDILLPKISKNVDQCEVISHGISSSFNFPDRVHRSIESCSLNNPFTILYVSRIESYKNQLEVIEAFHQILIQTKWPIRLQLVGSASDKNYEQLVKAKIRTHDPDGNFIVYVGAVPYENLDIYYHNADIAVFASSCENNAITLLEKMAAGLPVICNDVPPMSDFLIDAGVYVDFLNSVELISALKKFIENVDDRIRYSTIALNYSQKYTWSSASKKTFKYLHDNLARK